MVPSPHSYRLIYCEPCHMLQAIEEKEDGTDLSTVEHAVREMAQESRALNCPHRGPKFSSSSRGADTLFWPL